MRYCLESLKASVELTGATSRDPNVASVLSTERTKCRLAESASDDFTEASNGGRQAASVNHFDGY